MTARCRIPVCRCVPGTRIDAASCWTLLGEFNPGWFLPNLGLVIWPLFFLRGLMLGDVRSAGF